MHNDLSSSGRDSRNATDGEFKAAQTEDGVKISEGVNGRRYYVTNRGDWKAKSIPESYLSRWDIEILHRELKQDGLGRIFLRKLCKTGLYLRLMVTGRVLLEISGIRVPVRIPVPG